MLRKIIILLILFLWSIYYPSAEAQSPSNKRVVIFYVVSDGVISCQNSDGDLAKGKKQFEDTVRNNYKKKICCGRYSGYPEISRFGFYVFKRGEARGNTIILVIELKGQHTETQTWQNGFGATVTTEAPAIDFTVGEYIAYPDNQIHGYGPVPLYWSPGCVPIDVSWGAYLTEKDPRKNTKNAIKFGVERLCTFDKNINQYTNPKEYEYEIARYNGDFDKIKPLLSDVSQSHNENKV